KLFNVAPGSFTPAPKVTSAVLKLLPDTGRAGLIKDVVLFEALVRQAFSQRRKTLRNSLKGLVDVEGFEALSILPTSRAENVSVKDYVNMANMLYHQQNQ
ncbi:MAG: 16S rRNA (adenine1518-N6/adenine1519-N6)-dimethyltransferase, partial [Gammaproteobacteria bacterium]